MPYVGNKSTTFNTFSATDVSVTDDLTVTDDATIGGDLTVTGGITTGGSLNAVTDIIGTSSDMTIKNTANGENIFLKTTSGGSLITPVKIHSGGVFEAKLGAVFNEDSADVDFRVESNGHTDAVFVDAGQDEVFFFASDTPDGTNRGGAMFQAGTNERANLHLCCTGTGDNSLIVFNNGNGTIGTVRVNGSATAFNTSSDYRLKENVDYSWDATTRLKQLKPARFNFIADDTNTLVDGFLAHEVSSIVPEAISGVKDEVDKDGKPEYQGIDQSKLVPLLVKTIQELEVRIKALEDA